MLLVNLLCLYCKQGSLSFYNFLWYIKQNLQLPVSIFSYSYVQGIYGSKQTVSETIVQEQGLFTNNHKSMATVNHLYMCKCLQ